MIAYGEEMEAEGNSDSDDPDDPDQDSEQFIDPIPKRRRLRCKTSSPIGYETPFSKTLQQYADDRGLTLPAFKRLLVLGVPLALLNAMWYCHASCKGMASLTCMENFSGVAQIAKAFRQHEQAAGEFDIERHRINENMCEAEGFLTCLSRNMLVRGGGLSHWATVCSSWVRLG